MVPFKNKDEQTFIDTVLKEEPNFKVTGFESVSKDAISFIKLLLRKNPQKRISIEEMLGHAWLLKGSAKLKTKRQKCKPSEKFANYACTL